jgi:putative peptide zinc metalloprotease protein
VTEVRQVAPAAGRYAALTVVRDGDGYVLGSARCPDFVAVPAIGGQVVQWLQDGASVGDCARRAAAAAGEPVDVCGFIDGLVHAGLLPADDGAAAGAGTGDAPVVRAGVAGWKRAMGRALFGPVGLTVQGVLAVAAVVVMAGQPHVRPAYTDAIATGVPLLSILVICVLGTALGLAHELAHVLAAWAAGVSSRVSVSRRMIAIVFQTDLTRLWSVPRRARIVPLLAGLVFDAATIGVCTVLELTGLGASPLAAHLLREAVFLNISAIAFQFLIFLRTDVYALFVLATGCKHLWDTKGAVSRQAVRRATPADLALLAAAGRRETFWAKVFLCLYAPGVLFTTWYFAAYAVPALRKITTTALHAAISSPASLAGAAGAIAFALTAASTGYVVWGLARTAGRIGRQLTTRRDRAGGWVAPESARSGEPSHT